MRNNKSETLMDFPQDFPHSPINSAGPPPDKQAPPTPKQVEEEMKKAHELDGMPVYDLPEKFAAKEQVIFF